VDIEACKKSGILVIKMIMNKKIKKGLVIVNTGNGKGKSTSAFGVLLHAWGRGFRVCVVQFIKAETGLQLATDSHGPPKTWRRLLGVQSMAGRPPRKKS
jgi:ATP:corrinoid adenosyltransferase